MKELLKKKVSNKKAITLISLVVTIVILVILAAVAINMAIGNNGLFNKTKLAKQEYINSSEEEKKDVDVLTNDIDVEVGNTREQVTVDKAEFDALKAKVEALQTQNTMSATEHFTGRYNYDGKPIYAKTMYIASLPNATSKTYNHNVSDLDEIWTDPTNSYAIWNTAKVYIASLPYANNDGYTIAVYTDKSKVYIETDKDRTSLSAYVTLNYTKTTDVGNGTTIPATSAN